MNPKDAIEKLKEKQAQMVAEAEAMAMRADKLQRIVEFQNNPYDGWEVVALLIEDMQVKDLVLKHTRSGIVMHSESNISLEIHNDKGEAVKVEQYIGGEEE